MTMDYKPSVQSVLNGFEELYAASVQYKELKESLSNIEVSTFRMLDAEVSALIEAQIQGSVLNFFMEVGNILHDTYVLDPFLSINFHSSISSATFVPFVVTLLLARPISEADSVENADHPELGMLSILFSLNIIEGKVVLKCE